MIQALRSLHPIAWAGLGRVWGLETPRRVSSILPRPTTISLAHPERGNALSAGNTGGISSDAPNAFYHAAATARRTATNRGRASSDLRRFAGHRFTGTSQRTETQRQAGIRRRNPVALLRRLLRSEYRIRFRADPLSWQQPVRSRCMRDSLPGTNAEPTYVLAVRLATGSAGSLSPLEMSSGRSHSACMIRCLGSVTYLPSTPRQ